MKSRLLSEYSLQFELSSRFWSRNEQGPCNFDDRTVFQEKKGNCRGGLGLGHRGWDLIHVSISSSQHQVSLIIPGQYTIEI